MIGTVCSPPRTSDVIVRRARPDELPQVCALDRRASGCDRDRHLVLAALAELGCIFVHDGANGIDGLAIHSQAGSILHVGPVIAPSDDVACALVRPALRLGVKVCVHTQQPLDGALARYLIAAGVGRLADPTKQMLHMVRGAPAKSVPSITCYALAGGAMG